jgi:hypothetical protein
MIVRRAGPEDLAAVGRIAQVVAWEDYEGLLDEATISQALIDFYSPVALARRMLEATILVAVDEDGVAGFAIVQAEATRLRLAALAIDPASEPDAAGDALIEAARRLDPAAALYTDVLSGHRDVAAFYAGRGFVAGESVAGRLCGQAVVRRRWWLPPAAGFAVAGHG